MVTGDAPYRNIFLQAFNPVFQIQLIPVTIKALIKEVINRLYNYGSKLNKRNIKG